MKKLAFYLLMIPLFGIGMTSCSEDNIGPDMPETPQEDSVYVEDELAILQNHLVKASSKTDGRNFDSESPDFSDGFLFCFFESFFVFG